MLIYTNFGKIDSSKAAYSGDFGKIGTSQQA